MKRPVQTPDGYGPVQIALHWAIAGMVLLQLLLSGPIQVAFDARMDGGSPIHGFLGGALATAHLVVGSSILVLAVWRLALRLTRGAPPASMPAPRVIVLIGKVAHLLLYGFIFLMPVTGLVAWFFQSDLAAGLHGWLRWPFILLVVGHGVGALVEHMVFRNRTLERMLRAGPPEEG